MKITINFTFLVLVTTLLLCLKILGLTSLSWVWIFSPIWGPIVILVGVVIFAVLVAIFLSFFEE